MPHPIYLDNAATSFPKPEGVYAAVEHYQRQVGAAVGRGAYRSGLEVQGVVERCRRRAAELLRAESPQRIVLTFNGTDGLNLALHGLLRPGDHVVTSTLEHNSVLRPLRYLQQHRGIEVSAVEPGRDGRVEPAKIRAALRKSTRLVALIHASNVTGAVQPVAEVGEIARAAGAVMLVDAAQSVGHVPIDLRALPVDLLACPGHKGLLGPLGTGLLYVRPGLEEHLDSLRQGGTGTVSEDDRQPDGLPEKYEAGNHNAPGLCGLEAALSWLQERTVLAVQQHERDLTGRLLDGLRGVRNLQIHGRGAAEHHVGVVSVTVAGFEPQVLSAILDENFGIQTRAGLHCAPGAHRSLGTLESGGTVRLSVGPLTKPDEVDAAVAALREVGESAGS